MFEFIRDHCVRADSMRLSDFVRALRASGYAMQRTAIVAQLSRDFKLADVAGQTWIVGLSLRNKANRLRQFIDTNCIRADGLQAKLADIVRGCGLPRNQVIAQLQQWGFEIERNGVYVVRGLGLKEPIYA
jgi:predicted transcriptional regulator